MSLHPALGMLRPVEKHATTHLCIPDGMHELHAGGYRAMHYLPGDVILTDCRTYMHFSLAYGLRFLTSVTLGIGVVVGGDADFAAAVNAGSRRSPSRRRTKRHASAFAETRLTGLAGMSI
jgi:hypothetical protein